MSVGIDLPRAPTDTPHIYMHIDLAIIHAQI